MTSERPQLVFDLRRIPYARTVMVLPVDPAIEAMAVSSALQTSRFLDADAATRVMRLSAGRAGAVSVSAGATGPSTHATEWQRRACRPFRECVGIIFNLGDGEAFSVCRCRGAICSRRALLAKLRNPGVASTTTTMV